ncbi:MAG: FAD-dependent oxidoreductase, partial [Myxococcota bacterium]
MVTRVRPVNEVMQKVARRIAGVGTLPDEVTAPVPPKEHDVDVLVVGAGVSGIHAANGAAAEGASVLVVDEEAAPGGAARLRGEPVPALAPPVERRFATSLLGLWDEVGAGFGGGRREEAQEVRWYLAGDASGVTRLRARRLVVATGASAASLPVPGSDRPGVLTAEGAWVLLAHGVLPGERVLIVHDGTSDDALARALAQAGAEVLRRERAQVKALGGRPALTHAVVEGGRERVDAAVLAGPLSARYALAGQAGAEVRFADGGFVVVADGDGRTANPQTFAVGGATGRLRADEAQAERAGRVAAREARGLGAAS